MYFLNTELDNNKKVILSLTNVFGISLSTSKKICKILGFSDYMVLKDLNRNQVRSLIDIINSLNIITGNDLIKKLNFERKNLISIKCYRGIRLFSKLPVRGQRTHTNSKTCKRL